MDTKYQKPLVCAWCDKSAQYYAQKQLRHAISHSVCPFHKKFMSLKARLLCIKIGQVKYL